MPARPEDITAAEIGAYATAIAETAARMGTT